MDDFVDQLDGPSEVTDEIGGNGTAVEETIPVEAPAMGAPISLRKNHMHEHAQKRNEEMCQQNKEEHEQISKIRETAKKWLADQEAQRSKMLEERKQSNRDKQDIETNVPSSDNSWENVSALMDMTKTAGEGKSDLTRMREVVLRKKHATVA